jgi:hypothetical protein
MPNLFFPQLSTGAIAQYPIKKMLLTRNITNLLADGSMILQADPDASKVIWQMAFTELPPPDANALQSHFQSCFGPYHAFTFIDPTDNMLANSVDLSNSSWTKSPQIQITGGAADPNGGTNAVVVTNLGSGSQQVSQQLTVPANYQYCFSLFALSTQPATLTLFRQGLTTTANDSVSVGTGWSRFASSGRLNDPGTQVTVGISLEPGQQVTLFGLQLEAQIQPSRYRATVGSGGVYPNCHWASSTLQITSDAPNLFSTTFAIQSTP